MADGPSATKTKKYVSPLRLVFSDGLTMDASHIIYDYIKGNDEDYLFFTGAGHTLYIAIGGGYMGSGNPDVEVRVFFTV